VRIAQYLLEGSSSLFLPRRNCNICINLIYTSADSTLEFMMRAGLLLKLEDLIMMIMSRLESPPARYRALHGRESGSKQSILKLHYDGPEMLSALGFQNNDVLHIMDASLPERQDSKGQCSIIQQDTEQTKVTVQARSNQRKPCEVPRRYTKKSVRKTKKQDNQTQVDYCSNDNDDKINHSMMLTLVFEEAEPMFQERRRQLNDLALSKTQPKVKRLQPKIKTEESKAIDSSCSPGVGGKAGKIVFPILIGQSDYLYKSSKTTRKAKMKAQIIDLHGCTKAEALQRLNGSLPTWMNKAMNEPPWTHPVDVVTGGGSQTLAEAVEHWIRENRNVANRFA
jgi:DNA-nicking Smr family endonuclease